MKPAKNGAFANSATGYGKKPNNSNPCNKCTTKAVKAADVKTKKDGDDKPNNKVHAEDTENDLNSGFGTYLRSSEGVEMMKLFIFANTIMMVLTTAWPQFKLLYIWFMQWLDTLKEE